MLLFIQLQTLSILYNLLIQKIINISFACTIINVFILNFILKFVFMLIEKVYREKYFYIEEVGKIVEKS